MTGRLQLFQNFDPKTGAAIGRPKTLLVDSEQLEAGDALDPGFRVLAEDEIARFRRDLVERTGDPRAGDNITDQQLLRDGRVITDANNPVAADMASSQLVNRRYVVDALPAAFFVN